MPERTNTASQWGSLDSDSPEAAAIDPTSPDSGRAARRTSETRRKQCELTAQRWSANYDLNLSIDPDHKTAHIDMSATPPEVVLTGREVDQPHTDYDGQGWDRLVQRALNIHEVYGHLLHTDHPDFMQRIETIPTQYQSFIKDVWNAAEDAGIEQRIRDDRPQFSIPLLHLRANLRYSGEPGSEDASGNRVLSLADAIILAILDRGTLDTGRTDRLLDAADDEYQFDSDETRTLFVETIYPALVNMVTDVLQGQTGQTRNRRIFSFAHDLIDWLDDADDESTAEYQGGEAMPDGMPDDASGDTGPDQKGQSDGEAGQQQGSGDTSESGDEEAGGRAGDESDDDGDDEQESMGGGDSSGDDASDEDAAPESGGEADDDGDDASSRTDETAVEDGDGADVGEGHQTEAEETDEDQTNASGDSSAGSDDAEEDKNDRDGSEADTPAAVPAVGDIDAEPSVAEDMQEALDREEESMQSASASNDDDSSGGRAGGPGNIDSIENADPTGVASKERWRTAKTQARRIQPFLNISPDSPTTTRFNTYKGSLHDPIRALRGDKDVNLASVQEDVPDTTFVIVVDRSGSMSGNLGSRTSGDGTQKVHRAEEVATAMALALENDGANVVVLDMQSGQIYERVGPHDHVQDSVDSLITDRTGGGSPLGDALERAVEITESSPGDYHSIIMVTDDNPSSSSGYAETINTANHPVIGLRVRRDGEASEYTESYDREEIIGPDDQSATLLKQLAKQLGSVRPPRS